MRIFATIIGLALLVVGYLSFSGSSAEGGEPSVTAAIPAYVGAGMLLGVLVSIGLRKTGLQLSFLAALLGAGLGLGRLMPSYLDETLDFNDRFTTLLVAMVGECVIYVLVAVLAFYFRRRPVIRSKEKPAPVPAAETPVSA